MCEDVCNLRHFTSEPSEHTFGLLRYEKREFTVLEMCELVAKLSRKLKALYSGNLKHSRDPKKGYQATMNDFIEATKNTSSGGTGGPFKVTPESLEKDKALLIWQNSTLPKLLRNVSQKMKKLLSLFDVSDDDLSPFFSDFHGDLKSEILDRFVSYLPASFTHGGIEPVDNEADDDVLANLDNAEESHAVLHARIIKELLEVFNANESSEASGAGIASNNDDDEGTLPHADASIFEFDEDLCYVVRDDGNTPIDDDNVIEDTAMVAFMIVLDLVNDTQWQRAGPKVLCDGMATMDLKKRDKGSTSLGQKEKSLVSRWLTKIDVKTLVASQLPKGSDATVFLGNVLPTIERDVGYTGKAHLPCFL